jgi:hypothetical protein
LIVQHATIDPEHGDEDPLTTARFQRHSRRIRSKGDRRQVGHGQIGILLWFPRFDYEHEHRFTEHEHDICDWMPELFIIPVWDVIAEICGVITDLSINYH